MEIISEPKTEPLIDFLFRWLGGESTIITLRPDAGEEVEITPTSYIVSYKAGNAHEREVVEVFKSNLLMVSRRDREAIVQDPMNTPIQQRIAELAAAEDARKHGRIANPA